MCEASTYRTSTLFIIIIIIIMVVVVDVLLLLLILCMMALECYQKNATHYSKAMASTARDECSCTTFTTDWMPCYYALRLEAIDALFVYSTNSSSNSSNSSLNFGWSRRSAPYGSFRVESTAPSCGRCFFLRQLQIHTQYDSQSLQVFTPDKAFFVSFEINAKPNGCCKDHILYIIIHDDILYMMIQISIQLS